MPLTPVGTSDGSGGVILVWGHGDRLLCAQRLDAQGNTAWRTKVTLSKTAYWFADDTVVSDGHGGIIVAWVDWRNTEGFTLNLGCGRPDRDIDVYAQRVSHDGELLWGKDGIPVAIGPIDQSVTQVFSDGSGGAVIKWHTYEAERRPIHAQRIDAEGNRVWQLDWDSRGYLAGDGSGGVLAYITGAIERVVDPQGEIEWHQADSAIEKVDPQGEIEWHTSFPAIQSRGKPIFLYDGLGGAFVCWQGEAKNLYVRRIGEDGNWLWEEKREGISGGGNPGIVASDGSGGVIVARAVIPPIRWELRAHRLDAGGESVWRRAVWIGPEHVASLLADVFSDGSGSAIFVWQYGKSMRGTVMAQKVSPDGESLWGESGVEICAESRRRGEVRIIDDGLGGIIVVIGEMPTIVQRLDPEGRLLWGDEGVKVRQ